MTYLFYNWKFVPLTPLHPFQSPPKPSSGNHESVLCICELGFLVLFLDSTYKWDHTAFVFLCLTDFILAKYPQGPTTLSQMAG